MARMASDGAPVLYCPTSWATVGRNADAIAGEKRGCVSEAQEQCSDERRSRSHVRAAAYCMPQAACTRVTAKGDSPNQ